MGAGRFLFPPAPFPGEREDGSLRIFCILTAESAYLT